jgi:hypothetical protein
MYLRSRRRSAAKGLQPKIAGYWLSAYTSPAAGSPPSSRALERSRPSRARPAGAGRLLPSRPASVGARSTRLTGVSTTRGFSRPGARTSRGTRRVGS